MSRLMTSCNMMTVFNHVLISPHITAHTGKYIRPRRMFYCVWMMVSYMFPQCYAPLCLCVLMYSCSAIRTIENPSVHVNVVHHIHLCGALVITLSTLTERSTIACAATLVTPTNTTDPVTDPDSLKRKAS